MVSGAAFFLKSAWAKSSSTRTWGEEGTARFFSEMYAIRACFTSCCWYSVCLSPSPNRNIRALGASYSCVTMDTWRSSSGACTLAATWSGTSTPRSSVWDRSTLTTSMTPLDASCSFTSPSTSIFFRKTENFLYDVFLTSSEQPGGTQGSTCVASSALASTGSTAALTRDFNATKNADISSSSMSTGADGWSASFCPVVSVSALSRVRASKSKSTSSSAGGAPSCAESLSFVG
mmetsp:Transcript_27383/g.68748  ORF Transcript_27383/g.68748 Transcript_27383/m.68748 type:complete len:233 (+) Transcript_27383:712-1410(+)